MRVLLLGPPGAGKGTQGRRLAERYGISYIASGDLFRSNVSEGTELGLLAKKYMDAGELVPDDVTIRMVMEAIGSAGEGFLLDGFPRTMAQARSLDGELDRAGTPLTAALLLSLDEEIAIKRIAGRRTCERCGAPYNVEFNPPRAEGRCDLCGGTLVQRSDEREDVVRHRLDVYHESTAPLIGYYADRGVLREIDASGSEDEVTASAVAALREEP